VDDVMDSCWHMWLKWKWGLEVRGWTWLLFKDRDNCVFGRWGEWERQGKKVGMNVGNSAVSLLNVLL
jgi:hypothetical protein